MRIVAGAYRGRALVAPKGQSTRPTAGRTREALFNILEHAAWSNGIRDHRVLDIFAGSGALGLEAVSRGAAACLCLDNDPAALTAVAENIAALKLAAIVATRRLDVRHMPRNDTAPFDLVFLDPPYAQGLVLPVLAALDQNQWLAPGALIVVERGATDGELIAPGFARLDSRTWGAARVDFLRYEV